MDRLRAHVVIHGLVQGVWFRASTRDEAVRIGITGWVKNLRDGSVERTPNIFWLACELLCPFS